MHYPIRPQIIRITKVSNLASMLRTADREEMSLTAQIGVFSSRLKSTYDDDAVDRWHHVTTVTMLVGIALLLFAKNYVGEPLQCWPPAQWTDNWSHYAEAYCFVENTYFVRMNETNLPDHSLREDKEMIYYQWVPFILLAMAAFFYLPRLFWKVASAFSGLTLQVIMKDARARGRKNEKNQAEERIASQLTRETRAANGTLFYGNFLSYCYTLAKLFNVLNVLFQLVLLNTWLGSEYVFWGIGILRDMLYGKQWKSSGHFPRVTYCDITVRELGNVNNWTVQCVLMVNMFNEKIFIFLWFYLCGLLAISTWNLLSFVWYHFFERNQQAFLKDLLGMPEANNWDAELHDFKRKILKNDGLLILRMVDKNAGRLVAANTANILWKNEANLRNQGITPLATSTPEHERDPLSRVTAGRHAHVESDHEDFDAGPIGLNMSHFSEGAPKATTSETNL